MSRADLFDFGGEYLDKIEKPLSVGEKPIGGDHWEYGPWYDFGWIKMRIKRKVADYDWGCTGTGDCFDP